MDKNESVSACEAVLLATKERNLADGIFPDHNLIIDELLARRLEMSAVYEEIHEKLEGDWDLLWTFFDGLLCIAGQWNPEKVAKSRADRNRLKQVNQKIANVAAELAALLDERTDLNTHSGFSDETHYDICQVIEDASAHNGHFNSWVREPLAGLKTRFDMKYWPSLSDCLQVISDDAETAQIYPSNPTTAAATTGKRGGDVDFFKAFDHRLTEEGAQFPKLHPANLNLSHGSFAVLASCALQREEDEMFEADYVKRWRQREREAGEAKGKKATA